jgi:hypothetical protein
VDRVISVTTPPPGTGQSPQTTSTVFDSLGRAIRTTLSDGTSVTNDFYDTGELKKTRRLPAAALIRQPTVLIIKGGCAS